MTREPSPIPRRSWLLGTLGSLVLGPGLARGDAALDTIKARAKAAGLETFEESESTGYRAIGDARRSFREAALEVCEAVAADYRKHFTDKKFDLETPKEKLIVVILKGPQSYAAFEGIALGEAGGGHFDRETNWLVVYDFRGPGAIPKAPVAEIDNTFSLVHEAIHQLTFNTGVLDRAADIPLLVIEGLATYAETWGPHHRGDIGSINFRRRKGLEEGRARGAKWIPLESLLASDQYFDAKDDPTQQVVYAESWMFVHKLLKDPARLPQFRAYLKALLAKPDPKRRLELARARLGDLARLEKQIRPAR